MGTLKGFRFVAIVAAVAATTLGAGGGSPKSDEGDEKDEAVVLYEAGVALVESGNYDNARKKFESAAKVKKDDPDILNMLAYTQRKTGRLDDALETYAKALDEREKFPQAREYLGEAHLQAALEQLGILRSYGADGEKEAESLVQAFRAAIDAIESGSPRFRR